MARYGKNLEAATPGADRFATTHWSVVLAAGQRDSPCSARALAALCELYWFPLYAYVRRQGYSAHEAEDLTQAFFARFLEKEYLQDVDRRRGRFRSFLLAAMKHFLANQRQRARARKRGGGRASISMDFADAERSYQLEPFAGLTAERLFQRRWALALLDQVFRRLREESIQAGKGKQFENLHEFLSGQSGKRSYRQVAERLTMTEGAVKVAVHRLRRRYRELLREEISQTVTCPQEIEDELRDLFAAVAAEKTGKIT